MHIVSGDLVLFVINHLSLASVNAEYNVQQTQMTTSFRPRGDVPSLRLSTSRWDVNYILRG